MQTPGMLIMSNMAPGSLDRMTSYAQAAEARGLRNFLVTESLTDSLALTQHIAGKLHVSRWGQVLRICICATRCWPRFTS